ncbi:unnamed protein product [Porites lobata]|uniref:Uncharacterized protein n=1 Tax=Porites lobata TaxID=104759 RepID=A0ABN8QRU6_9CNID|nr:unnamed protein product [Porites lobata]
MFMDVTDKDQTLTCSVASNIQLTTLTDSKPDSKSFSKKSEDGKVNTALPATSMENIETNVTSSSGTAEKEVNVIMRNATNKRREPIVVFIGHSDREELSKDESSELPKFTSSPFLGLHPEIRSSNRQENDHVMFPGVMGYYGIASHKTVRIPEYHGTVTSLDRDEDEISTALGTSSTEITHPKENGLALQQKDTEIGTFALLEEPQSTLRNETLSDLVDSTNQTTNFNSEKADERNEDVKIVVDTLILSNDTKEDLRICPNHPQTGGSSFNKVHIGVCMKDGERLGLRIDDLPSLTTQYQDITFLRGSTAKKSRSRWMTKLVKDESTHAFYLTGFNQSGTEYCSKKTSPSVDSSWFIARLWNRGLVSVGLRKPSSVPRQTAKRPQYQRLAAVQISMFEICMTETNQTGPETLCCTKKAAKESCQTKSETFTTKLWIKGMEFVGWIRSNETREKAWNLGNFYLTKFLTKMMNWTWQDTFDMMTMILATECCYTAMYLAIPLIINIIKRFIRMLIRKWR